MQSKLKLLTHIGSTLSVAILCVACGGGGGSSSPAIGSTPVAAPPPPPPAPEPEPPAQVPDEVTISGSVTFQDVPIVSSGIGPFSNGLDYDAIVDAPARGVTVEALDSAGTVLATSQTSAVGGYAFEVPSETPVQIRVKAELVQTDDTSWNVRVQDNTNSDALYVLDGELTTSGQANSVRNLNADAGWGTDSYVRTRQAAPFAILDPIYETLQEFEATAPGTTFPPVTFGWSPDNVSAGGGSAEDRAMGEIGTSSYVTGPNGGVFILGEDGQDTDEYDQHVIVHEWGHYFEDQLSRSDSIGGAHSLGDRLDMRLAFGEGFGNAIAAIGNDDPIYRDTGGPQQSGGFSFNIEDQGNVPNNGWFSETSVQEILYDIFDSADDGADSLSLGLGPIFQALTSPDYLSEPAFTSIYSFTESLRAVSPGNDAAIDALLNDQSIFGRGSFGAGETNDGGVPSSLPVYHLATVNGPAVTVCSTDDVADGASTDFNNLGTRNFISFNNPTTGSLTFRAQLNPVLSDSTNNDAGAEFDPDFFIFNAGVAVAAGTAQPANFETLTSNNVPVGNFVIDFYDFDNLDETLGVENPRDDGDSCYNFTITR